MFIAEMYSHKNGFEYVMENHSSEFEEIKASIESISATQALCKASKEKNKKPLLFSPIDLNKQMKEFLMYKGWTQQTDGKKGFAEPRVYLEGSQFREMDGIKNRVGLEIQFGKYAFMIYDILSKMPIFKSYGLIDCGVEVVAMPSIVTNMSTGVSSFQQIIADLKVRGVADIDLPTLIVGIDCDETEWSLVAKKREMFLSGTLTDPMIALKGNKPGPK